MKIFLAAITDQSITLYLKHFITYRLKMYTTESFHIQMFCDFFFPPGTVSEVGWDHKRQREGNRHQAWPCCDIVNLCRCLSSQECGDHCWTLDQQTADPHCLTVAPRGTQYLSATHAIMLTQLCKYATLYVGLILVGYKDLGN